MPQFRSESSVAAAALSPRTFGRRPDRATVVCAPTDRYFVVKVRRGGAGTPVGAPGFQPQTAVDHRGLRPKLRSNTAISNRKLRSADRNFGRSPRFPTATSVAKTATAARICFERGAGLSPCARNTMREEIGRDTSSSQHAGHAVRRNRTRSAAGTFSGHRQRSRRHRRPVVWLTESLRRRAALVDETRERGPTIRDVPLKRKSPAAKAPAGNAAGTRQQSGVVRGCPPHLWWTA